MAFIDFDPSSLLQMERLTKKFGELAVILAPEGTEAAGKYILSVVKKEIPPYKYVSRKAAYGVTFFSDKQRRAVMAMIRDGRIKIPYTRTGGLENGWFMIGSGLELIIENRSPAATWTYSEAQSRHEALVGWRKLSSTLEEKERNATDAAARAIKKEIDRVMGG